MDITKTNFKTICPEIKSAINACDFIAIDCEFSGVVFDKYANAYDTYSELYNKFKRNVNNFLVLQYGLGVFRYDNESKTYKYKCYNFYTFPRPLNRNVPDVRFASQASSIDFLVDHDFDFNKVFKEGISYLNKTDETKYKQMLKERQQNRLNSLSVLSPAQNTMNIIPIPDEEKEFVEDIMNCVLNFFTSSDPELMLSKCNAFRRRLIYQTTYERFDNRVTLETRVNENKERLLYVMKPQSAEQREEKEKKLVESEMVELDEAVGFSAIIQHIIESQKLIVGHNLLLDLLHTVDKFVSPLPDEYNEFKDCVHCLFPRILDTKYLASSAPFKEFINSTILSDLIATFKNKPFHIPIIDVEDCGQGYSLSDNKEHEAGYDAYITGLSFLTMASYLGKPENLHTTVSIKSELLKPYLNKLFIVKLQDCPYLNLNGNDPKLTRDHVLHITFPKEWKTNDIAQLFGPFGNVHIAWISEKSAYVALYRRDQAAIALSTLSQNDMCTVISYARHQSLLHTSLPVAPSPRSVKRESEQVNVSQSKRRRRKGACFGESNVKRQLETINEHTEEPLESIATQMTQMFDQNASWD